MPTLGNVHGASLVPDVGGTMAQSAQTLGQLGQNKLLGQQSESMDLDNQQKDAMVRMQDLVTDAYRIKPMITSNLPSAIEALKQREQKVLDRGGDPSHTRDMRMKLESGEMTPEQAVAGIDNEIALAERLGVFGTDPSRITTDQILRSEELNIKRGRLDLDREKDARELKQLQDAVDNLDIPEEDKAAIKSLPAASLAKVLEKETSPKAQKDRKELEKKKTDSIRGAEEVRSLAKELLDHPGRGAATGTSSLLPTRPGSEAKDFEIKLERLESLMTVDNLDKMSGVLSETDIRILKAAAAGLDLGQSEEAFMSELQRIVQKMDEKLSGLGAGDSSGPQAGAVDGGYRFKGGDPADPNNWEQVR